MHTTRAVRALSISSSDSGAGSGIQADLKTFAALGVYGLSVVTAVTAQNTLEVAAIAEVPEEVVIAQIDAVALDMGANAVKTGMLSGTSIVENVADRLEAWGIPHLVVDPVMVSRGGVALLQPDAVAAMKKDLSPLATMVTPTIEEAEVLVSRRIATPAHAQEAAKALAAMGPETVLLKGGFSTDFPADLLFHQGQFVLYERAGINTSANHGTGCTLSAAITAFLAHGIEKLEAIRLATVYLRHTIEQTVIIGEGHSPVAHFAPLPAEIQEALHAAHR